MPRLQNTVNAIWRIGRFLRATKWGSRPPRDPVIADWFGGGAETASGKAVTPDSALSVVAVFAAVRVLAESVASLPLGVFRRRDDGGKDRALDHSLYKILHDQPNHWQTSFEFREMLMGHVVLRGNGYAEIISTGGRAVAELIPLHPDRVMAFRAPDNSIAYRYQPLDGPSRIILQGEMLHVRDFVTDGLEGISRIRQHRETIGLAIVESEHAARLFSNSVRPGGMLVSKAGWGSPEKKAEIGKEWSAAHGGVANAGKTAIMEGDLEWTQISLTSEDAQFLESREFSVTEIARMMRVPPHMIGDLRRATFSNVQQQSLDFVINTLRPWLVRWEQAIKRDLITDQVMFAEFNVEGMLRGDFEKQMKGFATGRQWGFYSTNDIRAFLNLNPIEDGDNYLVPLNMVPASELGDDVESLKDEIEELKNANRAA